MPDHEIPHHTLSRGGEIRSLAPLAQDERPTLATARPEVYRHA